MSEKIIPGLTPALQINSIYCIGRNYAKHAEELRNRIPEQPLVFLKPESSVIFDRDRIVLPSQSREVHHEVELVVAIGREGKNIDAEDALSHVAGYGVGIDVTARDLQQQAKEKAHPWTVAKGFDTFAPISTFLDAAEITDPQALDLRLEVNGEERQHGNTSDMIFPVKYLIAYLSSIFTLNAGDLIFTGTPEGVSPVEEGDSIRASLADNRATLSLEVVR